MKYKTFVKSIYLCLLRKEEVSHLSLKKIVTCMGARGRLAQVHTKDYR